MHGRSKSISLTPSMQIREKPESREEAAAFIDSYSQAPASTVGSVLWTDLASGEHYGAVDVSYIHMDPLPASARDQLIAEGEVFHCAGGLMMEHPLVAPLITRIEGSEDGVRGLAQGLVVALLLQAAKL